MGQESLDTVTAAELSLELSRRSSLSREKPAIPGYRLLDVLGTGAFGQVYKGVQESTGQAVAVKVLFAVTEGFREEVSRLSRVSDHPNVVTLVDANLQHDPPFLVTPYLPGSLQQHLPESPDEVEVGRVARWFEEIAGALRFVHGRGFLHCDLKPANILLGEDGQARLVDFGQSVALRDGELRLGSFWFMPWQQARLPGPGAEMPEVAWDLYALGATIYNLLTGRLPRATEETRQSLSQLATGRDKVERYRDMVKAAPLRPVRELNPGVDRDLAAIVEGCLKQDGEPVYSSASEVLNDLVRRRERMPVKARPRSRRYLLERFVARHRLSVTVGLLATGILLGAMSWASHQIYQARQARQALLVEQFDRGRSMLSRGHASGLVWLAEAARQSPGEQYRAALQEDLSRQLRIADPRLYRLPTFTAPSPSGTRGIATPQGEKDLHLVDLTDGTYSPLPPEIRQLRLDQKDTVRYRLDGVVLDPLNGSGGPATWRMPPWESVSPNQDAILALLIRPDLVLHAKRTEGGFAVFDSERKLRFEARGHGFSPAPTFSDRGDLAVGWEDGQVEVYRREQGWKPRTLDHGFQAELFCFSPGGDLLAGHDGASRVRVWDMEGRVKGDFPTGRVNEMAFNGDGTLLVCVTRDALIRGFDIASGRPAWSPAEMEKPAQWVFVQPAGQIVTMSDEVTVWRPPTPVAEAPLPLDRLIERVGLWTGWVYDDDARVRPLTRREYQSLSGRLSL